jgi:hypothetical protein
MITVHMADANIRDFAGQVMILIRGAGRAAVFKRAGTG